MKPSLQLLFLSIFCLFCSKFFAQPGYIDPDFHQFNTINYEVSLAIYDMAVQTDGKRIFVGGNSSGIHGITRLNFDGTTDSTFNVGSGFYNGSQKRVALQSDGKILVGGDFSAFNGLGCNKFIRLNTDGSRDTSFHTTFGFNNSVSDFAIQPDGKILVCGGFSTYNSISCNKIVRLNIDGTIDPSFIIGTGFNQTVEQLILQPDGKLFCVGAFSSYNGNSATRVIRLNPDGTIDTSFQSGAGLNSIVKCARQSDGKYIFGGSNFTYNGSPLSKILRINSDGSIDNTFNVIVDSSLTFIQILTDQKIVIGGYFHTVNSQSRSHLAILDTSAALLSGFQQTQEFDYPINGVYFNSDSTVDVYGWFTKFGYVTRPNMIRLDYDGQRDLTYHDYNIGFNNYIKDLDITNNGKIIVLGNFSSFNESYVNKFVRLSADGDLDTIFVNSIPPIFNYSKVLALPSGDFLLGGISSINNGVPYPSLLKLYQDGTQDLTFSDLGSGTTAITKLCKETDSTIMVCRVNSGQKDLVRIDNNGNIDSTFSVTFGPGFLTTTGALRDVFVQTDGKILVVGDFSTVNGIARRDIVRLEHNGSIDTSFHPGFGPNNEATCVLGTPDGTVYVGGNFLMYNQYMCSYFAKIDANGGIDTTLALSLGLDNYPTDMYLLHDTTVVVVGPFNTILPGNPKSIFSISNEGVINENFQFGTGFNGSISRIVEDQENRILCAGYFTTYMDEYSPYVQRLRNDSCNTLILQQTVNNVNCGLNDGSIDLTATGGTPPYTYLWSNGQNTESIDSLTYGYYSVVVSDAAGCQKNKQIQVSQIPIQFTDSLSACDSLLWIDGITYYSSTSSPFITYTSVNGCDSIVNLNLTINHSIVQYDTIIACNSYNWPLTGQLYTSSGLYTDSSQTIYGCDSVTVLNLTILDPILSSIFVTPSDSISCSGIISFYGIDLSMSSYNIDSFSGITASGTTIVDSLCPGIHNLAIFSNCGDTLDYLVLIPTDTNYLIINGLINAGFQDSVGIIVEDCNLEYPSIDTAYIYSYSVTNDSAVVVWTIIDGIGQHFDTAMYILNAGNGQYLLQLALYCPTKSINEYFVITEAIEYQDGNISLLSVTKLSNSRNVSIFPNPTEGNITITFSGESGDLVVYDAAGIKVFQTYVSSGSTLDISSFASGVYVLQLTTYDFKAIRRIVKH